MVQAFCVLIMYTYLLEGGMSSLVATVRAGYFALSIFQNYLSPPV